MPRYDDPKSRDPDSPAALSRDRPDRLNRAGLMCAAAATAAENMRIPSSKLCGFHEWTKHREVGGSNPVTYARNTMKYPITGNGVICRTCLLFLFHRQNGV